MNKATERQKEKIKSLGLEHLINDELTVDEAREIILDHVDYVPTEQKRKTATELKGDSLSTNSDWRD